MYLKLFKTSMPTVVSFEDNNYSIVGWYKIIPSLEPFRYWLAVTDKKTGTRALRPFSDYNKFLDFFHKIKKALLDGKSFEFSPASITMMETYRQERDKFYRDKFKKDEEAFEKWKAKQKKDQPPPEK